MATTAARAATRRETRREVLVDAASASFLERGVASTSVDDIVRRSGVAKGTFYLYFKSKDDVVNAVAERIVEGVAAFVEAAATEPGRSPVERLLALGRSVGQVGVEAQERELIERFHRPENRPIHDRLSERIVSRLLPTVGSIVQDGIEQGAFVPQDPRLSAAFVLSTFNSLHDLLTNEVTTERVASELDAFILRGLGYELARKPDSPS